MRRAPAAVAVLVVLLSGACSGLGEDSDQEAERVACSAAIALDGSMRTDDGRSVESIRADVAELRAVIPDELVAALDHLERTTLGPTGDEADQDQGAPVDVDELADDLGALDLWTKETCGLASGLGTVDADELAEARALFGDDPTGAAAPRTGDWESLVAAVRAERPDAIWLDEPYHAIIGRSEMETSISVQGPADPAMAGAVCEDLVAHLGGDGQGRVVEVWVSDPDGVVIALGTTEEPCLFG